MCVYCYIIAWQVLYSSRKNILKPTNQKLNPGVYPSAIHFTLHSKQLQNLTKQKSNSGLQSVCVPLSLTYYFTYFTLQSKQLQNFTELICLCTFISTYYFMAAVCCTLLYSVLRSLASEVLYSSGTNIYGEVEAMLAWKVVDGVG